MTEVSKHTPGPWRSYSVTEGILGSPESQRDAGFEIQHDSPRNGPGIVVARNVVTDADATLIATAPDLLAFADVVAGSYEAAQRAGRDGGIPHDIGQRARALVAQAEGR
jgi:hypothetical protein